MKVRTNLYETFTSCTAYHIFQIGIKKICHHCHHYHHHHCIVCTHSSSTGRSYNQCWLVKCYFFFNRGGGGFVTSRCIASQVHRLLKKMCVLFCTQTSESWFCFCNPWFRNNLGYFAVGFVQSDLCFLIDYFCLLSLRYGFHERLFKSQASAIALLQLILRCSNCPNGLEFEKRFLCEKSVVATNPKEARSRNGVAAAHMFNCTSPSTVGAGNLCRAFFLRAGLSDRTSRWSWDRGPCRSSRSGRCRWPEVRGRRTCTGSMFERLPSTRIVDLEIKKKEYLLNDLL